MLGYRYIHKSFNSFVLFLGLSPGKIAGIAVTCILVLTMAIVVVVLIFRCKRPKVTESSTTHTNSTTTTPGEHIPYSGLTQVMYVDNPQGAPQVVLPNGSPSVVYAQDGQIIQPTQTTQQSYVTVPASIPAYSP